MTSKGQQNADPIVLLVDAANVVGSVPDGWWRDRAAATAMLRDSLEAVASDGIRSRRAPEALQVGPIEVILVVEGKARGIVSTDKVRVVASAVSGDDTLVELARELMPGRICYVGTADRELIERLRYFGVTAVGPRLLRHQHGSKERRRIAPASQ